MNNYGAGGLSGIRHARRRSSEAKDVAARWSRPS